MLRIQNLSALRRLIVIVCVAWVVVLFAGGTSLLLGARHVIERRFDIAVSAIARTVAEHGARSLESVDLVLQGVADRFQRRQLNGDPVSLYDYMADNVVLVPQALRLWLLDADGVLQYDSDSLIPSRADMSDREVYLLHRNRYYGGPVIVGPLKAGGVQTFLLSRGIYGPHAEFLGVAVATISADYFLAFYRGLADELTRSVELCTPDGTVLLAAHSGGNGKIIAETYMVDGMVVGGRASVSTDTVFAAWRRFAAWVASGIALSVLASAGLAWLILRELRRREIVDAELRAAKEQAEAANTAKTEFLARMSHELRTPLNAVLGFSEVMEREMYGPLGDEHYRDYARAVHQGGSHLLTVINDILDISKAEAGKIELHEERFDLYALADDCTAMMRHHEAAAGITVENLLPPNLPQVCGDPVRIKQVLLNLLSNAVKFTGEGGRVTVEGGVGPDGLTVTVSDTGIGIAKADIDRVMAPFEQVDNVMSRRHEGTGLGLPLSRLLVERHGGTLTLESEPGRGTTVTLWLPRKRLVRQGKG